MRSLLTVLLIAIFSASVFAETQAEHDQRMAWWRNARFGMFIHFGLYSSAGGYFKGKKTKGVGEWIMNDLKIPPKEYEETLVPMFNPTKFDADKIASIAKDAGMKYIVITSKHHDGFSLYDSKANDYNVMRTPFKRDIMKELSTAVHKQGLTMCWYHSILDWHHPLARSHETYPQYVDVMKRQLAELITNYGHIGVLWFDGEWAPEWNDTYGREVYNFLREKQPDLIINNRIGKTRAGMDGFSKDTKSPGDFGTPEQRIPATGFPGMDWESCMTMNDTWGFKKDDHNWKSAKTLIRNLVDCSSKGGNYLLNVGPNGDGEIPAESVERLQSIGRWMRVNGESIYGTTATPFEKLDFGKCTRKGNTLYLHILDRPKDNTINLPMKGQIKSAHFLAEADVPVKVSGSSIELPRESAIDDADTVLAVQVSDDFAPVK